MTGNSLGHRVGVHGVKNKAERNQQEDRKQDSQPAQPQCFFDVVGWATTKRTVLVIGFIQLCQSVLDKA